MKPNQDLYSAIDLLLAYYFNPADEPIDYDILNELMIKLKTATEQMEKGE